MPDINTRIKKLVDEFSKGNVQHFVDLVGIKNHQNLNRVFNIDNRNKKYPTPGVDILISISEKLAMVDAGWLLTGKGEMLKSDKTASEGQNEKEKTSASFDNALVDKDKIIKLLEDKVEMLESKIAESNNTNNRLSALEKSNDSVVSSVPTSNSATAGENEK